jgi:hypothetical protein
MKRQMICMTVAGVALAGVLSGCGVTSLGLPGSGALTGSDSASESPATPGLASEPGQVQLLDPGTGPQQTLRLAVAPGAESRLRLTISGTIAGAPGSPAGRQTVPPAGLDMVTRVTSVAPNGDIAGTYTVNNATTGRPGSGGAAAGSGQGRLSGTFAVNSRGEWLRGASTSGSAGAAGSPDLTLLREALIPLPSEPVGRGARWTVRQPVAVGTTQFTPEITYTLRTLTSSSFSVESTYRTDPSTRVGPQVSGTGARLDVTALDLTARSTSQVSTSEVFPTLRTSRVSGKITSDFTSSTGATKPFATDVSAAVTMRSVR